VLVLWEEAAMSEKKIVVPEGMLNAYTDAWVKAMGEVPMASGMSLSEMMQTRQVWQMRKALEAALRWLSDELEKMIQDDPYINDCYFRSESLNENAVRSGYNRAIREVLKMFLAPESEVLDSSDPKMIHISVEAYGKAIMDSFRCGQKAGLK
jgi:hypothetical protein